LELTPFGGVSIRTIQWLLVLVEVKGVDVDVVAAFVDRETQEMREEDKDWVFMWFLFFLGL
jgi:hypothetical protein